jgi:ATP-dependent RNA helicase DDX60
MDLDGFGEIASTEPTPLRPGDPRDAIRYLDAVWYGALSRRARWMDLIGDYAGNEPFVIDGTSLANSQTR